MHGASMTKIGVSWQLAQHNIYLLRDKMIDIKLIIKEHGEVLNIDVNYMIDVILRLHVSFMHFDEC